MAEARQEARLHLRACYVSGWKAQRPRLPPPPPPPPSPHPAESLRSARAGLLLLLLLLAVAVVVEASINLSLMRKVRLRRLLLTSGLAFFHIFLTAFVSEIGFEV